MFNYILYRIGQFIAVHTPQRIAYKIACFISDIRYLFAAVDKRGVLDNLRVIFPQKTLKELKAIRLSMSRNFAKYLVDFFRFPIIDKDYIQKNISVENIHYFDEALSQGKGVVVMTAHLGNWELGGVVISVLGYPFWAVALPHKCKKVNDFFNHQRQSKGMRVIPMGNAGRQCVHVLKENMMLALVGDRDFNETGMVVDFFGKPTYFPLGPATFSMKIGSPIVPGFMFRNSDDTFTLRIEKPIYFHDVINESSSVKEDKHKVQLALINSYKSVIEDYIRKFPDQWYMFRKFWIE